MPLLREEWRVQLWGRSEECHVGGVRLGVRTEHM